MKIGDAAGRSGDHSQIIAKHIVHQLACVIYTNTSHQHLYNHFDAILTWHHSILIAALRRRRYIHRLHLYPF